MRTTLLFVIILLFSGCAPQNGQDPLKNTKKLIKRGHGNLMDSGMGIPFTNLNFIPSIQGTKDLSYELFFEDAKAALQQGLKDALASVYVIPEGTKRAYEISKDVYRVSDEISDEIRQYTRHGGTWLIDRSSKIAKKHLLGVFDHSKEVAIDVYAAGGRIEKFFDVASSDILSSHLSRSKKVFRKSMKAASKINKESSKLAKEHFEFGSDAFIQGYMALPKNLDKNFDLIREGWSQSRFSKGLSNANELREEGTLFFSDMMKETLDNYGKDVSDSFSKVSENFSEHVQKEGIVLSSIKSMGWLLKGIFYDGIIKPVAKLTASSVGLLSVNGVLWPIHVVAEEAKASAMVIVEVTAVTAKSLYDIVAPSVSFALASVLSSAEYLGGKAVAGTTATLGSVVSGVDAATGATLSGLSKATGFVLGESTKYIGVPIAVSAQVVGDVAYGAVASTASVTLGGGVLATGETVALATQGTGGLLSASTLVGGTGLSVAQAASQGLYYLGKSALLPAGYTLSSGTVLGYGSLSQLQAHTILAASDAAYMILSLEGPKWVLYTITGQSIKDDKVLPAGAVVDLKKMHENNEQISRLEVSDAEMQKVLLNLEESFPGFEKPKKDKKVAVE